MLLGHCPRGAATLAVVASTAAAGLAVGTFCSFLSKPRHTFLWLCRAEDDTNACFKHFLHP